MVTTHAPPGGPSAAAPYTDVFDGRRTASLRGHNGRNVALGFLLERMNLEVATLLGNDVKPERIPEVIRQLNGIRQIRTRALERGGLRD